jgi:hypothetical protein
MNDDNVVLGAMLRLARRRIEASTDELLERVGLDRSRIRASLARLDTAGLTERRVSGARLTMTGFAVALALRPKRVQPAQSAHGAGRHAA